MTTRNKVLWLVGASLVGYAIYRRFGPDRTAEAPIAQSQDGTVTEYVAIDCDCYRVDNNPDGTQTRTKVERALCRDDFASPSLAHCGGV